MECRILTQGLPEPPPSTAKHPPPPAKTLVPKPQPTPPPPHQFITIASLPTKPKTQPQLPTAPSTSSAVQYNSPSPIPIPRTTTFNQKKRKEREESGEELEKRSYKRKQCFNTCKHCKLPKTKDFGHSRHIGIHSVDTFCPVVEGKQFESKEVWMAARKVVNPPKPKPGCK